MATRRSRAGQDRKPFRRAAIFNTTIRLPSRRTAEFCGFAAVEAAKVWKLGLKSLSSSEIACLMEAAPGVCPVCVIDNTSVLLAAGAGTDAVIVPEILAFARTPGFGFRAHRVGKPRPQRAHRTSLRLYRGQLPGRSQ